MSKRKPASNRPTKPASNNITLGNVMHHIPLSDRSNVASIAAASKALAGSMLPPNFSKNSQVEYLLRLLRLHDLSWIQIVTHLHMVEHFNRNPTNETPYSYLRPRTQIIQGKLTNFLMKPDMSFEDFLRSLSVQGLGVVLHSFEVFLRETGHSVWKLGNKMEFSRRAKSR